MSYYAGVYALSMGVMLILKAVRGVVFVKVCAQGDLMCRCTEVWV